MLGNPHAAWEGAHANVQVGSGEREYRRYRASLAGSGPGAVAGFVGDLDRVEVGGPHAGVHHLGGEEEEGRLRAGRWRLEVNNKHLRMEVSNN